MVSILVAVIVRKINIEVVDTLSSVHADVSIFVGSSSTKAYNAPALISLSQACYTLELELEASSVRIG